MKKCYRKERDRGPLFSIYGIVIAAILAVRFLIFGWISVPYELAGPEALVFENPTEIEYELDTGEIVEESVSGIHFTVADSTIINWFPRTEIREVIVNGEPQTIAFVASCTRVKNGGNGTLLKLMEKYGHMIWSKEK